jgi:hypothetical protein
VLASYSSRLGPIGDPQAYTSAREVLKVARLSLVDRSSGILVGQKRISKRGRPALQAAQVSVSLGSAIRLVDDPTRPHLPADIETSMLLSKGECSCRPVEPQLTKPSSGDSSGH